MMINKLLMTNKLKNCPVYFKQSQETGTISCDCLNNIFRIAKAAPLVLNTRF